MWEAIGGVGRKEQEDASTPHLLSSSAPQPLLSVIAASAVAVLALQLLRQPAPPRLRFRRQASGFCAWLLSISPIRIPLPPLSKSGLSDADSSGPRVLIVASGSVATVKVPEIVLGLREELGSEIKIKVVVTSSGSHMLGVSRTYNPKAFSEFRKQGIEVLTDEDEWEGYDDVRNDKVVHIELRRWADLLLLAPCSAHTLAKVANGMSDNLATSLIRAWDPMKPLVVAPAMNTVMWEHPSTKIHLETLQSWRYQIVPPAVKKLACNDIGRGALAHVGIIVTEVRRRLEGYEERREGEGVGSWKKLGFQEWEEQDSSATPQLLSPSTPNGRDLSTPERIRRRC